MFGFSFPSWRSKPYDLEAANPPTSKKKGLRLDTSLISAPIPLRTPISITGFDVDDRSNWPGSSPTSSSPTRVGPSNIAWLRKGDSENAEDNGEEVVRKLSILYPPPAVVRLNEEDHTYPVTRSMSSPTPHTDSWDSSPANTSSRRWNMNSAHAGSTHSLRLETHHHRPMLSNGSAYSYPLMKPLSPIIEQDYISPSAPFKTIPLPSVSNTTNSTPLSTSGPAPSLAGSTSSERPSPAHSHHPFISRPVNRSISQTSHKSNASTSSSAAAPSSLSPLDFRSDSCGPTPTPSMEGIGSQLRTRKSCSFPPPLPTITAGSSEDDDDDRDQASFVTASDSTPVRPLSSLTVNAEREQQIAAETLIEPTPHPSVIPITVPTPVALAESGNTVSIIHSGSATTPPRSPPSASSSFIYRRWDRAGYPPVMFKVQKQGYWWTGATPAFWTFWLGFLLSPLAPILWLIGGWGFTYFGEIPPPETRAERVMSVWEFYCWKGLLFCFCCSRRIGRQGSIGIEGGREGNESSAKWSWGRARCGRRDKQKQKEKEKETVSSGTSGYNGESPRPPRWVSEKQSSDFRRAKLNDPKRSLKGIYFGYPFVPRDTSATTGDSRTEIWHSLTKPLNHIYGVKLTEVHGKPEGGRRMFDPWIQRCRYAFCYGILIVCAGLACGTTVLLVYNTRIVQHEV